MRRRSVSNVARIDSGLVSIGLDPVFRADARVLILGSFPGELSLRERQYYAHPRNQFWPIFAELVGAGPELPYPQRLQRLLDHRIALWDVLHACVRAGSLDSNIRAAQPNDFDPLLRQLPALECVLLNGSTAAAMFERHVRPRLTAMHRDLASLRLPSTSPANAGASLASKRDAWCQALA